MESQWLSDRISADSCHRCVFEEELGSSTTYCILVNLHTMYGFAHGNGHGL